MDLFAHRLIDSIEIVGDPLGERELVANCPAVFLAVQDSSIGDLVTHSLIE